MTSTIHHARIAMLSCLSLALMAAASARGADRMQTGKWEFAMTTNGQTQTTNQCVTKEQAAAVNGDTKTARAHAEKNAKGACDFKAYDVTGNTVTYKIDCRGATIESKATYHGDTFEGVLKSTREGKQVMTTVKAHRLGECE